MIPTTTPQLINLNSQTVDCVKNIENVGSTIYMNICNGNHVVVPWGVMDWLGIGCLVIALVAIVTVIIKAIRY